MSRVCESGSPYEDDTAEDQYPKERPRLAVNAYRIRFAFDAEAPSWGLDKSYLEVYSIDGSALTEPLEAPKLDDALANAVQVELFHFLLKQHGVNIPML